MEPADLLLTLNPDRAEVHPAKATGILHLSRQETSANGRRYSIACAKECFKHDSRSALANHVDTVARSRLPPGQEAWIAAVRHQGDGRFATPTRCQSGHRARGKSLASCSSSRAVSGGMMDARYRPHGASASSRHPHQQGHAMTTFPLPHDTLAPVAPTLVRRGELAELRRHVPADREAFMRWYMDPDIAELLRHDLEPLTATQARGYYDSIVLPASARGTAWAIYDRVSGNLLGSTAVTDIDQRAGTCLFRIVIGEKQAWGHGFGTDATRLVVAEAFERLGLRTVRLEVFAHNERARRAYERVGFRQTGRQFEWVPRRRRQLDVIAMAIDREGWLTLQGHGHDEAPR